MKIESLVILVSLCAFFVAGCATRPAGRLAYRESQFPSRLEFLRYCQEHQLYTGHCE